MGCRQLRAAVGPINYRRPAGALELGIKLDDLRWALPMAIARVKFTIWPIIIVPNSAAVTMKPALPVAGSLLGVPEKAFQPTKSEPARIGANGEIVLNRLASFTSTEILLVGINVVVSGP